MNRRRIAVLGGGVGAISAVWSLTSQPGASEAFDIHVYQMGWRLGGKGASGRNASAGQRIEEHGLHVWSGFYDNAFAMMRECLKELQGQEGVYQTIEQAFTPSNDIVLGDETPRGWEHWPLRPVIRTSQPGIGGQDLSNWGYFRATLSAMRGALDGLEAGPAARRTPDKALPGDAVGRHLRFRLPHLASAAATAPLHMLEALADALGQGFTGGHALDDAALSWLVAEVQGDVRTRNSAVRDDPDGDDDLRRLLEILDLGAAALKGMLVDRVFSLGFDVIDTVEIASWLQKHGAHPDSLKSPLINAVYDYVFGFRHGLTNDNHRAIAAGTFLRGCLRMMLTYKGAIFYKMNGGMGDTIFAPLHKALVRRGVTFHFFNKVSALHLDPTARLIDAIDIDLQVETPDAYQPFVRCNGLDCWPSAPDWSQITGGAALAAKGTDLESSWSGHIPAQTRTLRRGTDFDEVILGISLGALPHVAQELIDADPAWRRMVTTVQTTATQAVQVWLGESKRGLGWTYGPSILTAYEDPLNTWADMSHLIPAEVWPESQEPRGIAYFCGPLADQGEVPPFSDTGYPERMRQQVMTGARVWVKKHVSYLFPEMIGADGEINEALLVVPEGTPADSRWEAQYFRANVEPTERYVLSVPGSTTARLRADRSGFANLWLAGDWTYTGVNAGCVEAAVMSGMRAAAGLAGLPVRIVGEEADPVPGGAARIGSQSTAPVLKSWRPQHSAWPWSAVFGMAETTGPSVTLPVPTAAVAAMLPPGLALVEQTVTPPGTHPVILLFAEQRDVRMNLLPFGWKSYLEFICAVPWVRHKTPKSSGFPPLIWPQKLYLDFAPPIALGVHAFGFPKQKAAITFDDVSYVIRDLATGAEIIACSYERTGPEGRIDDFPMFGPVRPGYEMVMVTPNRLLGWQYSVYDFSLESAQVAPLRMQIRIGANEFGLPPGLHHVPALTESSLGGFFIRADGTINNPMQHFDIRQRLQEAVRP